MSRVFIEEFEHRPGGHCGTTALRDLLGFHGHDLTEDMVFGLGSGIGFIYYRNPQMNPPVYIGGRIHNLEEHLCSNLGIGMEVVSGLEPGEGWLAVREMLDRGIPVMVHADVYYLDYLKAKRHFSGHRILIVGYDEEKDIAFIADNDRDSIQECSLASLARARSAAFPPQPADNAFYRFTVPTRLTPLPGAIRTAIARSVRFNLRIPPERANFTHDGSEVVQGIEGLKRFSDAISGWPDDMDPGTLSLLCKSIYVSAEKGGTGYGGNFRRLYGRFLKESSGILALPGLDRVGDEFIAIGDIWTKLSLTFKDFSGDGGRAVLEAAPMAREISGRETEAFKELEAVYEEIPGGEA